MLDKKEYTEAFLGYAIEALRKLGYTEKDINDFIKEINYQMQFRSEQTAIRTATFTIFENTQQVMFDGITIPVKYNPLKFKELFEQCGFTDKKSKSHIVRVLNVFSNVQHPNKIIYVRDLYGKTVDDIREMRNMGKSTYQFFIQTLKSFLSEEAEAKREEAEAKRKEINASKNTRQIIFQDIIIPTEYNLKTIKDVLTQHGFMGKEYNYKGVRVCNTLKQYNKIIYFTDLYGYGKSKGEFEGIGDVLYDFFYQALREIFQTQN